MNCVESSSVKVTSGGQRNYRLQRVRYPSDLKLVNFINAP